jgi:hypothetical protein
VRVTAVRMSVAGLARARGRSVAALALALLATAPLAAASTAAAASIAPAVLPPELQSLESKMAQLRVDSERYSITVRGSFTSVSEETSSSSTCTPSGCHSTSRRHVTHRRHRSVNIALKGEVSLAAGTAELVSAGGRHRLIVVGPNLYSFSPGRTHRSRARPWVHSRVRGVDPQSLVRGLFPLHGNQRSEVDLGGRGPYAHLINLLATAVAPVLAVRSTTVDGQPTVEFAATVRPARLIERFSAKELAKIETGAPQTRVQAFLTESGLPQRVVAISDSGSERIASTIDLLAVNPPVDVQPPPGSRTRAAKPSSQSAGTQLLVP